MINLMSFLADFPRGDIIPKDLGAGEALFRRDSPVRAMHFLLQGVVHLVRGNENGDAIVLQRAVTGSVIAEASLFSDRYHCDAVSQTRSEVIGVRMQAVRERLETDEAFRRAWTRHLAEEIQRSRARCALLSLNTVSERLDAWLALQGGELPTKGDWRSVAEQIAVRPESLYRELARRRRTRSD